MNWTTGSKSCGGLGQAGEGRDLVGQQQLGAKGNGVIGPEDVQFLLADTPGLGGHHVGEDEGRELPEWRAGVR